MDCLVNNEVLINWLLQYGSIAVFFLLVFGILALPIPEETLMIFSGIMIRKGNLGFISTLFAAYAGSICGITLSYLLGHTLGNYLIEKYSKKTWVSKHYHRAQSWFGRYGKWTLFIGYFIPGVRHFTGFSAGTVNMKYKKFALFAYSGAFLWVSLFIFFGFFFGNYCFEVLEKIDLDLNIVIISLLVLAALYLVFFRRKK